MVWLASLDCRADQVSLEITNLWMFPLAPKHFAYQYNSGSSTPAIAPDGTVYVGSFNGTLFAITPEGKEQWQFKAKLEIHSSPAIGTDGTVYFGSRDRNFYAVTPAGKLKWAFATGAWVDSSPAIAADGTIYFGSWDKKFYALNPDGSLKWKFATEAVVDSSPAIAADGTIYFGSHDWKFYALNTDGTVRWAFQTGGEIIASPALGTNGTVYFSALDGNLYAVNPDGSRQWQVHTGGATEGSPVVDELGRIYLAVNGSTLAYTREGKPSWGWPASTLLTVPPAVATGQIYFSRPWLQFHVVSPTGQFVGKVNLPNNLSAAPVIDQNGQVYVVCERQVCAIRPPNATPPAPSSWPMFRANARHTGRIGDQ